MRRLMACATVLAGVAVCTILSACGTTDADEIKSALKSFNTAFVAGDGRGACDLLTDEAKHKLENQARRAGDCAAAVTRLRHSEAYAGLVRDLDSGSISDIELMGLDEARAYVKAGSASHLAELQKLEEDWRISTPPGF